MCDGCTSHKHTSFPLHRHITTRGLTAGTTKVGLSSLSTPDAINRASHLTCTIKTSRPRRRIKRWQVQERSQSSSPSLLVHSEWRTSQIRTSATMSPAPAFRCASRLRPTPVTASSAKGGNVPRRRSATMTVKSARASSIASFFTPFASALPSSRSSGFSPAKRLDFQAISIRFYLDLTAHCLTVRQS